MHSNNTTPARAGFTQIAMVPTKAASSHARSTSMSSTATLGQFTKTTDTALQNGDFSKQTTYQSSSLRGVDLNVFSEPRSSFGPGMRITIDAATEPITRLSDIEKVVRDLEVHAQCVFQLASIRLAVDFPPGIIPQDEFVREIYVPWAGRHREEGIQWVWGRNQAQIVVAASEHTGEGVDTPRWEIHVGKLKLQRCKAKLLTDLRSSGVFASIRKHCHLVAYDPKSPLDPQQANFQAQSLKLGINDALKTLKPTHAEVILLRRDFKDTQRHELARVALLSLSKNL